MDASDEIRIGEAVKDAGRRRSFMSMDEREIANRLMHELEFQGYRIVRDDKNKSNK